MEDKNETSRLKILLGFSLWFFFSSLFLGLNFFLLPLLHLAFSLQLPEQVPAPFPQGRGGTSAIPSCSGRHLLPCPGDLSCYWQLKSEQLPTSVNNCRIITAPSLIPGEVEFQQSSIEVFLMLCCSCWSLGVPKTTPRTSPLVFLGKKTFISINVHPV